MTCYPVSQHGLLLDITKNLYYVYLFLGIVGYLILIFRDSISARSLNHRALYVECCRTFSYISQQSFEHLHVP